MRSTWLVINFCHQFSNYEVLGESVSLLVKLPFCYFALYYYSLVFFGQQ